MPSAELKQAILELAQYYSLFTLKDLVGASIAGDQEALRRSIDTLRTSEAINSEDPISEFSRLIVDAQTGAHLSKFIIDRFDEIAESSESASAVTLLSHFFPLKLSPAQGVKGVGLSVKEVVGSPEGFNDNPNDPTKNSPSLAVFSVNTTRITPSSRNSNAAALFMNSIPTIEFSKCVPFLDIQFQLYRPAIDTSGRPQTLSITRFLEGGSKLNGGADHAMHSAVPIGGDTLAGGVDGIIQILGGDAPNGFSGMEIFTAPQTLVNADPDNSDNVRVAPVIDKFRPLLSIGEFNVSVVATTGIMCYKTAKLELTLHDRSRLYEIADFVKPDMAGSHNSELLIEYGWSHPDTQAGSNSYGPFINSMRKKEKYHIKNSSFSIKDNGEVAISLELYMKGALDFYNSSVTDGGEIEEAQKAVANIQERMSDYRSLIFKQNNHMKEIRGIQILNAAQDQTSQLELSKEMKKELRSVLGQLRGVESKSADSYANALEELYGKNGDGNSGAVRTLLTSLSNELQRRMNLIEGKKKGSKGPGRTFDPFGFDFRTFTNFTDRGKQDKSSKFVSFGKLAMIFLGQPLVATKKFDEVQFMFYPMNSGAGFARNINVAQFPIEISRFKTKFNKIKTLRRTNDLTLRDFIQFMGTTFFDDPAALAYGMRDLYTYENDKETGTNVKPKRKFKNSPLALEHERDKRSEASGVPGGVFKMPQLDVYVETVPAANTDAEGNSQTINDSKTILRVHFFDRRATSYESLGELLRSVRDSDIGSIKASPPTEEEAAANDHDRIAQQMYNAATEFGLIEDVSLKRDKSAIEIKGGPQRLKEFIKSTMPSITYGQGNTAVISAGFQTQNEPRLSTVNMLRSGDANPLTATGVGQGGLPLWMAPGQMDMNIMGCPIIEFAQGFFVDFDTNTSIDNIYHVTKIDHTIKQGEFKTQMSLVPFDAYGQYRALRDRVASALAVAKKLVSEEKEDTRQASGPTSVPFE